MNALHVLAVLVAGAALALAMTLVLLITANPVHAAECGKASFYADAHQGRLMANGRPFDMRALTAASNSLPLGSRVQVTAGKRHVDVTITDRGGFAKYGRVLDLSQAAFARLAPIRQGVVRVCIARAPPSR
jgi:rare lipoprotein A (peptidoglycan hydrolase)